MILLQIRARQLAMGTVLTIAFVTAPACNTSRAGSDEGTFEQFTPAERMKLIGKLAKNVDKEFVKIAKGDVVATIVERGSLEAVAGSEIVCPVKASDASGVAATIKWVIEDGTPVKKGQLLMVLDSPGLSERVRTQKATAEQAQAMRSKGIEKLKEARKESQTEIGLAEIDARIFELELKKYAGNDPIDKEILKLRLERSRLAVERSKAQARAREALAETDLRARESLADLEMVRLRELEQEINACRIVAPRDGLAVYFASNASGILREQIIDQGEPVKKGQKLLRVVDPKRLRVRTAIHEAMIAQLGAGQKAAVHVDAFPDKSWAARVEDIASVPRKLDFLMSDVRVHPVELTLSDEASDLRPGMSADVRIETARKPGVLQLPVQTLLRDGRDHYCYVKVGQELQKRRVIPGLKDNRVVEIKDGLKEGDEVLRDPRGLWRRVAPLLRKPAVPVREQSSSPTGKKLIHVGSVPPQAGDITRRTFMLSYGLTDADLERISFLPGIAQLAPALQLPIEARRRQHGFMAQVIGTTPSFAEIHALYLQSGRFVSSEDILSRNNVAVLGADAADALFPDDDPIGQVVVLLGQAYSVIGVLRRQDAEDDVSDINARIYVPLATFRARTGKGVVIRRSGTRQAVSIQLSDIYLTTSSEDQSSTAESIRTLLEEFHDRADWKIQVGGG